MLNPGRWFVFILALSICAISNVFAGTSSFSSINPTNLNVCGDAQTFYLKVTNTSLTDTIKSGKVTVKLPVGFHYVAGSYGGSGVSQYSISNDNQPIFSIPNILPKDSVKFSIQATVDCKVIAYINSGGTLRNMLKLTASGGVADSAYTSFFSVGIPSVSIGSITNQVFTGSAGDTFSRKITITNTSTASLKNFSFYIVKGSGIVIKGIKTKTYTTSSDTLKFSFNSTDFKAVGNGDNYFDYGESIVLRELDSIALCTGLGNTYTAYWGCNGSNCQQNSTTSNVVISSKVPYLYVTTTPTQSTCYTSTTANKQTITIYNTGTGIAKNVLVDAMMTFNIYAGYYQYMYSRIDPSSITIQYGSKGTARTVKADSLFANYAYTCLGSNPKGRFWLKIPVVKVGDTITITFNIYDCCIDQGYINAWGADVSYTDQCGSNTYDYKVYGQPYWYNYQFFGTPTANTSDLIVGDTVDFYLENNYNYNSLLPGDGNHYLQYSFSLPKGVKIDTTKINQVSSDGTITWKPDSVRIVGGQLHVTFGLPEPSKWSYYGSRLNMRIAADTSGKAAKCGDQVNLGFKITYQPRIGCSCISTLVNSITSLKFNCVNPDRVGLNNASFSFKRTSYGKPDNNDDGVADASGSLDFTKIRTDKAMYGDTLTAKFAGKVLTDSAYTSWKYGFIDMKFTSDYLSQLDISFTVKDSSAGKTYTCTSIPYHKVGSSYYYYFGVDSLRAAGCSALPSSFTFDKNDSIWITIRYKVTTNTQNVQYITLNDEFYMSDKAQPASLLDHYSVNKKSAFYYAVGWYFVAYGAESYTTYGCGDNYISESNYLSIGNCCANYNGGNMFPYEYRYWGNFRQEKMVVPGNYTYQKATYYYYRTAGTGKTVTYTASINPSQVIGDTLVFNVDSLYQSYGGTFPLPDDGFAGTIVVDIAPNCGTVPNTQELFNYQQYYDQSAFLGGGISPAYKDVDYITYKPLSFSLQPALPTVSAKADTVSWTLYISNLSNSGSVNKPWLALQSPSSKISIDSISKGNKKLVDSNGIYRLGSIAAATTNTYRIYAHMRNCVEDSIKVYFGWSCDKYPDSLSAYKCSAQQLTLYADPQLPGMQVKSLAAPDSIYLCDTASYTVSGSNTQSGTAFGADLYINLPQGTSIVKGKSSLRYPMNTAFAHIADPDSVNPYLYVYHLAKYRTSIQNDGLPGSIDTAHSSFRLNFKLTTNCDYISGSNLEYSLAGLNACGNAVSTAAIEEKAMKIIGAKVPYSGPITVKGQTSASACGGTASIRIKFLNNGPSATDSTDYIDIDLPKDVHYMANSLVKVHNSPSDSSLITLALGTTTRYGWKIPKGIAKNDSVVFSISYRIDSAQSCGNFPVLLQGTTTQKLTCVATHTDCAIKVQTALLSKTFKATRHSISISKLTATAVPSAPLGEKLTVKALVTNNGDTVKANSHAQVKFYYDADNNGKYSSPDIFIGADTVASAINTNGTYNVNKTFFVQAGKTCRIIATWDTTGYNCNCSFAQAFYGNVLLKDAGRDTAACGSITLKPGTDSISGYSYHWSPATGLSNVNTARPVLSLSNSGSITTTIAYVLSTTRSSGCTTNDTVRISLYPLPKANAGSAKTTCSKVGVTIGGSPAASGGTSSYTYKWTPSTGLSSSNIANPTASPSATTLYTLQVTDSKGCTANDTVRVIVLPLPVATAGSDKTICQKDTVVIGGSPAASGTTGPYTYSWSPASGLSSTNVANPKASPSSTTNYILSITDSKGCKNTDTVTVNVNPLPTVSTGSGKTICAGDSVIIGGSPTASGTTGPYTYIWSPSAGLSSTTVANPKVSPASTSTYTVTVTDAKGCKNSASVTVTVNPLPKASAGTTKRICKGDRISIGGSPSASGGKSPYTYIWFPSTGLSSTTSANPFANPVVSTTYKLTVQDANGCKSTDAVIVNVNPLPVLSAGTDDTLCKGDSIILKGTGNAAYRYYWSPGKYLKDSTQLIAKASPTQTTAFVLTAIDSIGCKNTDTVTIYVRPKTALNPPVLRCANIAGPHSVQLSWDTVAANSQFANYKIYRKSIGTSYTQIAASTNRLFNTWTDTNAINVNSTSYSYYISVINKCGIDGKASDTLNTIILSAVQLSDKALKLSWNIYAAGSPVYMVLYDTGAGFKTFATTTATNFTISSCKLKARYQVEVKGTTCNAFSNSSGSILLDDSIPPYANKILNVSTDNWTTIHISFLPSDSNDTRSYYLYRGDSAGNYSLLATIAHVKGKSIYNYVDNTVNAQRRQYFYKIKSIDSCGNVSAFSSAHSPVLLKGKAGDLKAYLNWRKYIGWSADSVEVQKYILGKWQRLATINTTDSTYTDSTNLGCNVTYYYRIASFGNSGKGLSYSDSIAVTPFDTVAPTEVNMLSASVVSSSSILLNFKKVPDVDVNRYDIYAAKNHGIFSKIATVLRPSGSTVTYLHTGITTQQDTFRYEVRAVDSCANNVSKLAETHTAINLKGKAADYAAHLNWSAYKGFTVKNYIVQLLNGSSWKDLSVLTNSDTLYTDTLIPCNITRYYRIKAVENAGDNAIAYSDSIALTPFDTIKPAEPQLTFITVPANGKVQINWTKSASPDVKNYTVYRYNGSSYTAIASLGNVNTYTDSIINTVNSYCYAVQAMDSCARNKSGLSPPHCSMALQVTDSGCKRNNYLNWNAYSGWSSVSKYEVYRSVNGGGESLLATISATTYSDTGLDFHKNYCYRIKAYSSSGGVTSYSNDVCKRVFFVDTPQIIAVSKLNTSVTAGQVHIQWKSQAGKPHLAYYQLYYSATGQKPFTLLQNLIPVKQDTFIHKNINTRVGDHYYYLVTVDSCGTSSDPSVVHKTMDLNFTVGQLIHQLNWTPYKGWAVKNYIVQFGTKSGLSDEDTLPGNDTSFRKFPAPCNSVLYYRIKAVSFNGALSYSDSMGGQAIDTIPSNAPTFINATVLSNNKVRVNFLAADSADTYGYSIQRSINGGIYRTAGFVPHVTRHAPLVFTDSTNTLDYHLSYQIIALDSCLNATPSQKFSVIQLQGTAGNLKNYLHWYPFVGYPVSRYEVGVYKNGSWQNLASVNTDTSFTHDSLSCNVPHSYKIEGFGTNGLVTYSDSITLTPFDTTRPLPPTITYVSVLNKSSISVNWQYSPSKKVKQYEIQYKSPNGPWKVYTSVLLKNTVTVNGLNTHDSSYSFRIIAIDTCAANRSFYSNVHQSILLGGAPQNLANKLSWSAYGGFTVTKYYVYKYSNGSWSRIDSVSGATLTYTDTGLHCNVPYSYKVSALSNSGQYLSYADSISLTPFDTTKPPAPLIKYATVLNGSQIQLFWNKSVPKVKQYELWMRSLHTNWKNITSVFQQTSYTFSGLNTTDSTYFFRIAAIDTCAGNKSPYSTVHAPVQLSGRPGQLSNLLNWSAYVGFKVQKYYIYNLQSKWQLIDSVSGDSSSYLHQGLLCNIPQYYRIGALDSSGRYLSYSDTIRLVPFDTATPAPPLLYTASVLPNNSVKISWHWDLNSRVKQFEIWRSTNKAPAVRIVTVNSDSTYTDRFALPQYNDQAYYVIGIDSCSSLDRSAPSVTDSISRIHLSTGGCYAQVVLNWSRYYQLPGGTDAYEVYRSVNRGAFSRIATVTALTYTDAAVDSLHRYAYEVKAISNSNALYSFSDSSSIVPWVYPLPGIVNLTYSSVQRTDAVSGAIKLNWNRYNFLKDTFARGYRLYHSTNINGPYSVVLDTQSRFISSYLHKGINTISQPHFYYLKVYNLCNREGDSNRIHSPAKLSLQNRNGEVAVYWKKYNGFDSVKNYYIYRSDNGGSYKLIKTVSGSVDSLTDTNVYCGHQYIYRLAAQSADLKVPLSYSDSESVISFDTIPPPVPLLQFATTDATSKTNGRITLSFMGNSTKNRSGYKVYISSDGINYALADSFKRTLIDTLVYQKSGLNTSNTAYSFYVTAIDSCGNTSLASDTQTVVNLKAIAKNEANVLHWSAYKGFKQYSYTIERKTRNTKWVQLVTFDKSIFDYHDSATICDTQYIYRIVTVDSVNNFVSLSNIDSATAFETDSPAAPVIVNATVLQTGTANGIITINWKRSKGRRIDYYNLYRFDEADRKWVIIATKLRSLAYNDSNLNTYRSAYRYRLEVVDSCGNPSRGYSITHQSMVLRTVSGDQSIKLKWSAYAGWSVAHYDIYRDGLMLKRMSGTDTTYTDTPAQCPVLYHYRVVAIDANDSLINSVSSQDSARPYDNIPPHKPYLIRATVSQPNNQVALEWTRSHEYDAKGYLIMRKNPPNTWYDILYRTNSLEDTSYTDTMHMPIRQQYCYQVKTFDHCGNISDSSNTGCVILAQGEAKNLANVLQWNGYEQWPEGVAYYNIYRKTDTAEGYRFLQRFDKPVLMYTDTGIEDDAVKFCYRVEAVEKGGFNASSWSTELCLVQAPVVWIPNAFTPVASYNINDFFGPRGLFIGRYEMEIFNRWGQDIYSTRESKPWDGTAFGKPAPDGLYLYNITVYDHNGQKYYFKGTVVVLK